VRRSFARWVEGLCAAPVVQFTRKTSGVIPNPRQRVRDLLFLWRVGKWDPSPAAKGSG
jgi:hypothetical protein